MSDRTELPTVTVPRPGRCGACRFWSAAHGGECRHNAPRELVHMTRVDGLADPPDFGRTGVVGPVLFPPMPADGWCGEWAPADKLTEGDA
jgi:hypothetical protein